MRYPPGHKEQTRLTILEAAARVFRSQGFQGGGVYAVMAEAGLTPGGFYAHFKNKEDLFVQLLELFPEHFTSLIPEEFQDLQGMPWVEAHITFYLSPEHRDAAENCCLLPSLISEVERRGEQCRQAFASAIQIWVERFAGHLEALPEKERLPAARAIVTLGMGACSTARALGNTRESDAVLKAARDASMRIAVAGSVAAEVC